MRVFVCGLVQESNSFNPALADMDAFKYLEGEEIVKLGFEAGLTISGMLEVLGKNDITAICGVKMRAGSGAPLKKNVVEHFIQKTVDGLKSAGSVDGVLLSLHGATLSEISDDVCGDIVEKVRQVVGEDVIVSVSCDLHANVTEKMAENADIISGYQAYPHIDLYETGVRAAELLVKRLNGEELKMARAAVPVMAPAHGYTTTRGGLKKLMDKAFELKNSGEIIDFSIFQVQPWLDCKNVASAIIVVAEDGEKAKKVAAELARDEFELRGELQGEKLFTIGGVIEKALKNESGKPIVLVDSSDSRNAGASGDSAAVIEALLPYRDVLKAAADVTDAPAVEKAFELGVGAVADFMLGATIAPNLSKPVLVKDAKIKSLHNGSFERFGPQEKGTAVKLGKTAVLEVGKLLIHISEYASANGDMNFYRGFGIDPLVQKLVNIKACTSFRACYEAVSEEICNTSTPGAAGTVLTELPFENLTMPVYPFAEISEKDITEPKIYR